MCCEIESSRIFAIDQKRDGHPVSIPWLADQVSTVKIFFSNHLGIGTGCKVHPPSTRSSHRHIQFCLVVHVSGLISFCFCFWQVLRKPLGSWEVDGIFLLVQLSLLLVVRVWDKGEQKILECTVYLQHTATRLLKVERNRFAQLLCVT